MYQVPTCIFGECSQGSFARAFQWSNILWTGLRDFHEISNHILFYEINTPRFLKMSSTLGGVYKKVKSFTCYILDNWLTFTNILFINWTCTGLAMWYPKRAERKALSTSSKVPHLSSVWFLFRLITVYLHVSFGHWRTILFLELDTWLIDRQVIAWKARTLRLSNRNHCYQLSAISISIIIIKQPSDDIIKVATLKKSSELRTDRGLPPNGIWAT